MDTLRIDPDGTIRAVYTDTLGETLFAQGKAATARASHVEPLIPLDPKQPAAWCADLQLSGGPILGPYNLRAEALEAEIQWIDAHVLRKDTKKDASEHRDI